MGIPSARNGEGIQHLAHKMLTSMRCLDGAHALIGIDLSVQSIDNLCG